MKIQSHLKPMEFSRPSASPASTQENNPFGSDAMEFSAAQVLAHDGGSTVPCSSAATDVNSGLEMGYGCQNSTTDVKSGLEMGYGCQNSTTDVKSGLEMGYGCQNGTTDVNSGWKLATF